MEGKMETFVTKLKIILGENQILRIVSQMGRDTI